MKRSLALLLCGTMVVLALGLFAQNPPAQNPPAENPPAQESAPPPVPMRVGPPPENATAAELEHQGDLLRAHKSYNDALDYYHAALKKAPTASVWNKIGITELQLDRPKDAKKSFDRAVKLDPTFAEAYNNRGAVYYITGALQQDKAERRGKTSIPGGARKNYRKAMREYSKALQLREDSATYHSNLGTAYFALKDFPDAVNEYSRALQLDPDIFERRSQSGIAAHMASPEDRAHYSFVLARMYAKTGNLDRALLYLRKAMEDGYKDIDEVYKDQEFAALRKDPRFAELMQSKIPAIPQ